MPIGSNDLPRWNLDSIYPAFDSHEYLHDKEILKEKIEDCAALSVTLRKQFNQLSRSFLFGVIRAFESAQDMAETLNAYTEAVYTADTRNEEALKEINALDMQCLPLKKILVEFQQTLFQHRDEIMNALELHPEYADYRFFIEESVKKATHQLLPDQEELVADLSRSGADAWARLHESMSSNLSIVWNPDTGEQKTVTALRELAFSPDRTIREKAYRTELTAWQNVERPIAACLNGIKGWSITIDKRRRWETPLHKSAFQSRIEPETLHTLVETVEESLPIFRRYLHLKAKLLGIPVLRFYDLFAPVGTKNSRTWTWEESADFIVTQFSAFDPDFGAFAKRAFDSQWIDAGGREGKVGGAYCTDFPLRGESRILCNFDGSFDSVSTVAHELGHAWHHECIKDLPRSQSQYPMTLAETASTFAETIVFEGALAAASPEERIGLIEGNLKDCCQTAVDILSRFYFEKAVFEQRERSELSPAEFCALMIESQKRTYDDSLDPEFLHPYMWAVKSHYYSAALPFYNYPYAFGQLFSLSLYAQAQKQGPDYKESYRKLLRTTGQASAESVAALTGFNIRNREFWLHGVSLIEQRVREIDSQ
ncbi:oligoendopeptidase F [Spirochaetia bacterium]|nr:oligoendopeptidase F [Spirochaetia bacterium]GHU30608.1 oligoendopeptidase F [Spirochaetia bacterium]